MTNYPKITIITPSYNQGEFIEETILSVINQNYPNLQYVIIDGGSTDNTLDIIKKYESKIDYWLSEKDEGQSHAINKGLRVASGTLVNWINSDDVLEPNALFNIADLYLAHPSCGLFVGQTEVFSAQKKYGKTGNIVLKTREITFAFGRVNQPAMFYNMDAVKKMGLLDEALHYCMDVEWWLRYLLYFDLSSIVQSETVWARFRIHDTSKTVGYPTKFKKEKERIYQNIFSFYGLFSTDSQAKNRNNFYPEQSTLNLKKSLNYYYLWRSDELSIEKQRKEAFKFWLKVNPFKLEGFERRRYFAVLKNMLRL